jgi:hypothetical protein
MTDSKTEVKNSKPGSTIDSDCRDESKAKAENSPKLKSGAKDSPQSKLPTKEISASGITSCS